MRDEKISESQLLQFFAGQTSEEETNEIIKWIESSDKARRIAKDIYYIYYNSELEQVKRDVDADLAFNSVENKIYQKKFKLNKRAIINWIQKVAAIIIIPLSIFTGYLLSQGSVSSIHYVEVSAKQGMVTKAVLPDSTVVWLNSGSTLKYPSAFLSNSRNVELEGEAYFDVQKDVDKPFSINTRNNFSINVLGTQFNVEAYTHDNQATTTLVEGKVSIEYQDNEGSNRTTYLTPSQKLVYDIDSKEIEVKNVSVAQYIAWKDGKIIFENTSLKEALQMLGKYFNVDFEVKNRDLYSNSFTGKFEGERLEEILMLIKISSNINYTYKSNDLLNEKRQIEIF